MYKFPREARNPNQKNYVSEQPIRRGDVEVGTPRKLECVWLRRLLLRRSRYKSKLGIKRAESEYI